MDTLINCRIKRVQDFAISRLQSGCLAVLIHPRLAVGGPNPLDYLRVGEGDFLPGGILKRTHFRAMREDDKSVAGSV